MLPSLRLIAATFLCGFFVVLAGLRIAASLNDIHEGAPVLAAHAAPVSIAPAAEHEVRRALAAGPVIYDLRFGSGTMAATFVSAPPTFVDRLAPLAIAPSEASGNDSAPQAVPDGEPAREAAKQPEPEPAAPVLPPAMPTEAESAVVAEPAAEPAAPEPPPPAAAEPRPAAEATGQSAAERVTAQMQAPPVEQEAVPAPWIEEPLAAQTGSVRSKTAPVARAVPLPKRRSAAVAPRKPRAAAKAAPPTRVKVARKKPAAVARRATPAQSFGNPVGGFGTWPGPSQR